MNVDQLQGWGECGKPLRHCDEVPYLSYELCKCMYNELYHCYVMSYELSAIY